MPKEADNFFLGQAEPIKGCLLALRSLILNFNADVTEVWRYKMPFYSFDGKRFCYLWMHKKFGQPYLGIVNGNKINDPGLLKEKRSRMKIFLVDPAKDIPVRKIRILLGKACKTI